MDSLHRARATGPKASRRTPIPLVADQEADCDKAVRRRAAERQAQSRVLREVCGHRSAVPALTVIARSLEQLLGAQVGLCFQNSSDFEVGTEVCLGACGPRDCKRPGDGCPLETAPLPTIVPLRHFGGAEGRLWIRPSSQRVLGTIDQETLATFAELAVFGIDQAAAIDIERHDALLSERDRIAREMHDSLAQVLGVTHIRLRALAANAELNKATETKRELADLGDLCHEAYADVRETILGLRESTRSDHSLLGKLERYVELFAHRSHLCFRLVTHVKGELQLTPQCEAQVFRVVQEALNNVRKHAEASVVELQLIEDCRTVTFMVSDDGRGFDPKATIGGDLGFGLRSMAERADLIDGSLDIYSSAGEGTTITLVAPAASWTARSEEGTVL